MDSLKIHKSIFPSWVMFAIVPDDQQQWPWCAIIHSWWWSANWIYLPWLTGLWELKIFFLVYVLRWIWWIFLAINFQLGATILLLSIISFTYSLSSLTCWICLTPFSSYAPFSFVYLSALLFLLLFWFLFWMSSFEWFISSFFLLFSSKFLPLSRVILTTLYIIHSILESLF